LQSSFQKCKDRECIVHANPEFEKLFNQPTAEVDRKPWSVLHRHGEDRNTGRQLDVAVVESSDFVGTFRVKGARCSRRHRRANTGLGAVSLNG
jgi:hypothetical protein